MTGAMLGIALATLGTLWETWWMHPLWGWSIEAIGGPGISFSQFFILNILVSMLTRQLKPVPAERDQAAELRAAGMYFLSPVVLYFIALYAQVVG